MVAVGSSCVWLCLALGAGKLVGLAACRARFAHWLGGRVCRQVHAGAQAARVAQVARVRSHCTRDCVRLARFAHCARFPIGKP